MLNKALRKKLIAGGIFLLAAIYVATIVPSTGVAWAMAILLLTVYLFAFEIVDVDVAARGSPWLTRVTLTRSAIVS